MKYGQLQTDKSVAATRQDITDTLRKWSKELVDIRIGMRDVEIVVKGSDGQPRPFRCSRFPTAEQNMRALFYALDNVRLMEQRGILQEVAEMVSGFLEAPGAVRKRPWWEVLGIQPDSPDYVIEGVYKAAAKQYHPDGGKEPDAAMMAAINAAYEEATAR